MNQNRIDSSTQTIELRYGADRVPLDVPQAALLGVVEPKRIAPGDAAAIISGALDAPVGSPPLEHLARPGGRVTVLIDDNTRPTPAHLLLPPLLARLASAGVRPGDVKILVAGGSHRAMTDD